MRLHNPSEHALNEQQLELNLFGDIKVDKEKTYYLANKISLTGVQDYTVIVAIDGHQELPKNTVVMDPLGECYVIATQNTKGTQKRIRNGEPIVFVAKTESNLTDYLRQLVSDCLATIETHFWFDIHENTEELHYAK